MANDKPGEHLKLDEGSPSVQSHIVVLQNVIARMATNSSACKTWCITIVTGLLVVTADKSKTHAAFLALLPIFVFAALDSYYLALEKGFRQSYNDFVRKVHMQALTASDLYSVEPSGETFKFQLEALRSLAIQGFYFPLLVVVGIALVALW